jgi:hypothetical protein
VVKIGFACSEIGSEKIKEMYMKLSRLFLVIVSLVLSANGNALGWEECKHLYPNPTPEQKAACNTCIWNIFPYNQCRFTAPVPIQYITVDGQSSQLTSSATNLISRNLVLKKGVASSHLFSWPSRLGNVRIEYSFLPKGTTVEQWSLVGVFSPGSTYTIVDYAKYIPASVVWSGAAICSGGWRPVAKASDATLVFRARVEDLERYAGKDPQNSSWSYFGLTNLYYGSDMVCMPRGMIR